MVNVKKNLTGERFGRLTVIQQSDDYIDSKGKRIAGWYVSCDCDGKIFRVRGKDLKSGHTKSCGCYSIEKSTEVINKVNELGLNKKMSHNEYDLSGEYGKVSSKLC